MRFDDRLETILGHMSGEGRALAHGWSQLVDLLAQGSSGLDARQRAHALQQARDARPNVPDNVRQRTARALAPNLRAGDIICFFAEDRLSIAAPVVQQVMLEDAAWREILPRLPVPARALVRERRDLSEDVRGFLASFGPADFALPAAPPPDGERDASDRSAKGEAPSDFVALLARIEERQGRAGLDRDRMATSPALDQAQLGLGAGTQPGGAVNDRSDAVSQFYFLTGPDGLICRVMGIAPGALIGLDLSRLAAPGGYGVDGLVMGSVRKRTPFRDGHLRAGGLGPAQGLWRISGVPCFSRFSGRFLGYRGLARRDRPVEARSAPGPAEDPGHLPDGLRQFIHELRTPLNAIRGFAEILAEQLFGPVAIPYRDLARAIVRDAEEISDLLDDLPWFLPEKPGQLAKGADQNVDAEALITDIFEAARPQFISRQAALLFRAEPGLPLLQVDAVLFERLVRRLVHALLAVSGPFDRLQARLGRVEADMILSIRRPMALRNVEDGLLFDPDRAPDADPDEVPFGLAYAFRLIRRLADRVGARLELSRQSVTLRIAM
ncbi:MAG: sensor histidine kinase [Chakrabartia sp.]